MPYRLHISEEEVREELKRLGYGNVSDSMIVSFRKDLLHLIKADIKKLKEERLKQQKDISISSQYTSDTASYRTTSFARQDLRSSLRRTQSLSPSQSYEGETTHTTGSSQSSYTHNGESSEETHISQSTTGSSMPSSAHGLQHKITTHSHIRSKTHMKNKQVFYTSNEQTDESSESGYSDTTSNSLAHQPCRPSSASSQASTSSGVSSSSSQGLQRMASVGGGEDGGDGVDRRVREHRAKGAEAIKHERAPSLPCYPRRCDPVSLYHFYKAHWDAHPTPGEDPRAALRWQVRADLFYSK